MNPMSARVLTASLSFAMLGLGSAGAASPAAAVTGDFVVGPAGCGDVGYVTDGTADNVQIQAAVEAAGDGDTVAICAGRYEYDGDVDWSEASADLVIRGAGAGETILDGNNVWNVLAVRADDVRIELQDLTLENGLAGWGSALLLFDFGGPSTAVLRNVNVLNNDNEISVGAITVEEGSVEVYGSYFEGNDTPGYGGAIYVGGDAKIVSSIFENNESESDEGGAIYVAGDAVVTRSTFIDNHSEDEGGAIFIEGDGRVSGSLFTGNHTHDDDGGAINGVGALTVSGSTFIDNDADSEGGAINAEACGTVEITANKFIDNYADSSGGAVNIDGCGQEFSVTLLRNRFESNVAEGDGGAFDVDTSRVVVLLRSNRFENNVSLEEWGDGGAIWVHSARLLGNTFAGNTANCGGAVYVVDTLFGTQKFNGFRSNSATDGNRVRNVATPDLCSGGPG